MTENPVSVELANRIAVGLIELGVAHPNDTPKKPNQIKTKKKMQDGSTKETVVIFRQEESDDKVGRFKWSTKFSTLVSECPQLKSEIDAIRNEPIERDETGRIIKGANKSQRINKKLQDVFTAAIRIILEKSDAPEYYREFRIEPMTKPQKGSGKKPAFICPKNSTLNDKITITHYGKNPDYRPQR